MLLVLFRTWSNSASCGQNEYYNNNYKKIHLPKPFLLTCFHGWKITFLSHLFLRASIRIWVNFNNLLFVHQKHRQQRKHSVKKLQVFLFWLCFNFTFNWLNLCLNKNISIILQHTSRDIRCQIIIWKHISTSVVRN